MCTRHSPLFLLAPLTVVLAVAGLALIATPTASAKKATPQVTELQIYRTPSGPEKGALTVIAMLDYRGFAKTTFAQRTDTTIDASEGHADRGKPQNHRQRFGSPPPTRIQRRCSTFRLPYPGITSAQNR